MDSIHAAFKNKTLSCVALRLMVAAQIADLQLDAILYPLQNVLVSQVGQPQWARHGTLSNGTGFPTVTFPGGFAAPSAQAPIGVPVGAGLLVTRVWL